MLKLKQVVYCGLPPLGKPQLIELNKKISLGTQLVFEGLQRGSLDRLAVLLSQCCRSHRSGAQHSDAGSAAQGTAGGTAGTTQGAGTWGRAARACGCDWHILASDVVRVAETGDFRYTTELHKDSRESGEGSSS